MDIPILLQRKDEFLLNFSLHKTLHSKKYGVDLISFTRNQNTVVHGSTKIDGELVQIVHYGIPIDDSSCFSETLRQLNLAENRYVRYFSGHTKKYVI